jgi:hypothetical protein
LLDYGEEVNEKWEKMKMKIKRKEGTKQECKEKGT